MNASDHVRMVDALLPAVLAAGRLQMALHGTRHDVALKPDQTPVTEADRQSEEVLLEALARIAPGVAVIAEESASAGRVPDIGDTFFLVDPLDGTREFIEGRREFTVNIGLIEKDRPVLGIVYAPALSELYVTQGRDAAAAATVPPAACAARIADTGARPIRTRIADPRHIVALASKSHLTPETSQWLARLNVADRRQAGSSLKFCVVARGEADVYPRFGQTSEWDTAAGDAVLCAAGGRVTEVDGRPLRYGKSAERYLNPSFIAWGRGDIPVSPV